ncbi:hypothetical protein [Hymenobacter rubripertinctus]|uniref:Uncharacterized protein n=1 Tax=Hymenobacter rubripertinctus TaxID=2029981 RepID=A0A418R8B3_9BACT|nr:hypothetical protein [Hymenobacter rubripertinctus]RIY13717.1 hypothetical protein D0T11_01150 [Hymenobacter rubripertinctus]
MPTRYTLAWFKEEMAPQLTGCSLVYRSCGEGDFGYLERVEVESETLLGTLDFWSHEWLDLHLIDRAAVEERLNLFLSPNQEAEKEQAFIAFLSLL